MNDDHLSDHEWRLKQAAEGKAIYIPGKTVEEMKAERAATDAKAAAPAPMYHPETVSIWFHLKRAEAGAKAADEAAYWYSHVGNVFDLIFSGISSGHFAGNDHRIASLAEICAFTFHKLADTQGEELQRIARDMQGSLQAHKERKQAETGEAP